MPPIAATTSATVFAGILHIHCQPTQVLQKNLAVKPAVAARTAGGNQNLARWIRPHHQPLRNLRPESPVSQIQSQSAPQSLRLLINFAQHFVGKGGHRYGPVVEILIRLILGLLHSLTIDHCI